jgi:hypothetical protein
MPKFRESFISNLGQSVQAYMQFLQERNKQNLWAILAPPEPPVEEQVKETPEGSYAKQLLMQGLNKGADWFFRMSGTDQIVGGLLGVAKRNVAQVQSQYEREFSSLFLPLQYLSRDIVFQYEQLVAMNPEMSALGSTTFGLLGGIAGTYYMGPVGGALLGTIGDIGGALYGPYFDFASPILKKWWSDMYNPPSRDDLFDWFGDQDPYPPTTTHTGPTVEESNYYRERETYRKVMNMEKRFSQRLF